MNKINPSRLRGSAQYSVFWTELFSVFRESSASTLSSTSNALILSQMQERDSNDVVHFGYGSRHSFIH